MSRTYCVTYEIVTPESAERGDAEERGFCDGGDCYLQIPIPDGLCGPAFAEWYKGYTFDVHVSPDDWTGYEEGGDESAACCRAMASILLDAGATETSGYPHQPGDWYTAYDADHDYRTGATTSYSYHLDGWTPEEERRIAALVKARNPRAAL